MQALHDGMLDGDGSASDRFLIELTPNPHGRLALSGGSLQVRRLFALTGMLEQFTFEE